MAEPAGEAQVVRLRLTERLRAVGRKGQAAAQPVGQPGARDELQALAQTMLRCYLRGDFRAFDAGLRRVMRLAPGLGLPLLGEVAGDVRHCLIARDSTALSATWARLLRLTDQALLR